MARRTCHDLMLVPIEYEITPEQLSATVSGELAFYVESQRTKPQRLDITCVSGRGAVRFDGRRIRSTKTIILGRDKQGFAKWTVSVPTNAQAGREQVEATLEATRIISLPPGYMFGGARRGLDQIVVSDASDRFTLTVEVDVT